MKKGLLFLLLLFLSIKIFSQNTYTSIGGGLKYFLPSTSRPIAYYDYKAQAVGGFFEYYHKSHWKIHTNIDYYHTTFERGYIDDAAPPARFDEDGVSHFLSISLTTSYNLLKEVKEWEFLVGGGYNMFMNLKSETIINHSNNPEYPQKITSSHNFTRNYLILEIAGRYRYDNNFVVGFGTKSYHFIPVNGQLPLGFPSLAIQVQWGYIF